MSAANRNRGARAEVAVVNYLRANGWPDARRYLAGDGRQPGDIDFHPLVCLEVKDVASSAWPTWCRHAAAEARPGMVPVVVRRTRGVPDVGAWPVRVAWRPAVTAFGLTVATDHLGSSDVTTDEPITINGGLMWWVRATMAELVAAVKAVDA